MSYEQLYRQIQKDLANKPYVDPYNQAAQSINNTLTPPANIPQINSINNTDLINARMQAYIQQHPEVLQPQQPNTQGDRSNLLGNIYRNAGEIGTGLLNVAAHPIQTAQTISNAVDYTMQNPVGGAKGLWNAIADDYNLGTDDIKALATGQKDFGQFAKDVGKGIYEHPVDAAIDFVSLGGGKLLKVGKLGKLEKAAKTVEGGIAVTNAKVAREAEKVVQKGEAVKKIVGNDKASLAKAVDTFENATILEATDPTKKILKPLKEYSGEYDGLVKKFSPETWDSNNKIATIQRGVRQGIGANYQEVEKALTPYYDNPEFFSKGSVKEAETIAKEAGDDVVKTMSGNELSKSDRAKIIADKERILTDEGRAKLTELANKGDEKAKFILDSEDLHKSGKLVTIPHGMAEVEKIGEFDKGARKLAGRFSSRVFGTAEYGAIAEQLLKPSEWLDKQITSMVERTMANEILERGTLGGEKLVLDEAGKDVQYVSRDTLAEGTFKDLSKKATDAPVAPTDIPIDKNIVKELEKQSNTFAGSNPFKGTALSELYNINKGVTLASGSYLAGNVSTGFTNMLLNAGLNPVGLVQDIGSALVSKGRLAKEAGIYRHLKRTGGKVKTPVLSFVDKKLNAPVGNFWNVADAATQNFFTEVALHNNLRKMGVKGAERSKALVNMADNKLAGVIRDAKKVSLVHPTRTLLPTGLHNAVSLTNPFWRWMDTAAQSSLYMLEKSPVLSNIVLVDLLSNIGLNQELQNRMGLGVETDKPFVSYRYNPRTKKIQEVSAEFVPMMNSLKVGGTLAGVLSGQAKTSELGNVFGTSMPFISAVTNSFFGKTKYGKPILRSQSGIEDAKAIQGDKRYMKDPVTGQWVIDDKFHIDEPLTATAKELIAPLTLYNRTIGPALAAIASQASGVEQVYNAPYDNALAGWYNVNPYHNEGNVLQYGNPAKTAGTQETLDRLMGLYTSNYYPERDTMSAMQARRLQKSAGRRMLNNYLLNQGGF